MATNRLTRKKSQINLLLTLLSIISLLTLPSSSPSLCPFSSWWPMPHLSSAQLGRGKNGCSTEIICHILPVHFHWMQTRSKMKPRHRKTSCLVHDPIFMEMETHMEMWAREDCLRCTLKISWLRLTFCFFLITGTEISCEIVLMAYWRRKWVSHSSDSLWELNSLNILPGHFSDRAEQISGGLERGEAAILRDMIKGLCNKYLPCLCGNMALLVHPLPNFYHESRGHDFLHNSNGCSLWICTWLLHHFISFKQNFTLWKLPACPISLIHRSTFPLCYQSRCNFFRYASPWLAFFSWNLMIYSRFPF